MNDVVCVRHNFGKKVPNEKLPRRFYYHLVVIDSSPGVLLIERLFWCAGLQKTATTTLDPLSSTRFNENMISCLRRRMHYVRVFYLTVVVAATATIRTSSTKTDVTKENSAAPHHRRRLHDDNSYNNRDDSSYQKSECVPRLHNYDSTAAPIPAPEIFHVEMVLTTTRTPSITTTTTSTIDTRTKISTLTIQFNRTWSPRGVDRLYQLVLDHYLDCAVFFRVVPGN